MAIKAVVFDVSGTLVFNWSQARPGVADALDQLRSMDLTILTASNESLGLVEMGLKLSGLRDRIDHVIVQSQVGKAKGGPAWVNYFRDLTGFQAHEFFYVGDSDYDIWTATRGPMIYAHAQWSEEPGPYGLHAPSPAWVVAVIRHIFRKQHPWYWKLETTDGRNRPVRAMTLLDANGAGSLVLRQQLLQLFKDGIDCKVGTSPMDLSEFVMLHMLASIYEDNVFGRADLWTTMPGHLGEPNTVMGAFLDVGAKLSRKNKYRVNLFDRHRRALRSRDAWERGGPTLALTNQTETVRLGAEMRDKVQGKGMLLLDNFLTRGYTTEVGRNLLLAANSGDVVVAAVGKYGPRMHVITAQPGSWDSFSTNPPGVSRFDDVEVLGSYHSEALEEFSRSHDGISTASW